MNSTQLFKKTKDVWSRDDTTRFLKLWKDNNQRIRGTGPKQELFRQLAAELAEEGIYKTGKQLHKKIENMKLIYNKYRMDGMAVRWQYYDPVHDIMENSKHLKPDPTVKERDQLRRPAGKKSANQSDNHLRPNKCQTPSRTATSDVNTDSNVLNVLKRKNQRLLEDLNFELNLNKILENIRNNSLILMQNCKCLTNQKNRKNIKHLNTIYTDLKTSQHISELSRNRSSTNTITIESDHEVEDNLDANRMSDEVVNISDAKTVIDKNIDNNPVLAPNNGLKSIGFKPDLNKNFSLITEMLQIDDNNHESDTNSDTDQLFADNDSTEFEAMDCKPILGQTFDGDVQQSSGTSASTYMNESKELSADSYGCELCDYTTTKSINFSLHKALHSSTDQFQCPIGGCHQWFPTKRKLFEHKKQNHCMT